jgi:hypothetical protein
MTVIHVSNTIHRCGPTCSLSHKTLGSSFFPCSRVLLSFDLEPSPPAGPSMLALPLNFLLRLRLVQRTINAMDMRANSEASNLCSSEQGTGGAARMPSLAPHLPAVYPCARARAWT